MWRDVSFPGTARRGAHGLIKEVDLRACFFVLGSSRVRAAVEDEVCSRGEEEGLEVLSHPRALAHRVVAVGGVPQRGHHRVALTTRGAQLPISPRSSPLLPAPRRSCVTVISRRASAHTAPVSLSLVGLCFAFLPVYPLLVAVGGVPRHETRGDMGRYGEIRGGTGRYGEIWGDVGRYGEIWGGIGRYYGEIRGGIGRYYGEIS